MQQAPPEGTTWHKVDNRLWVADEPDLNEKTKANSGQQMYWAKRDGFHFTIEAPQAGIALAGQKTCTKEVWDRAMNSIRTRHKRVFNAIPAQDSGLEDDESHEHSQRTLIRVAELKRQYDEVSAQLVDAAAARAAAVAEAAEAVAARKAAEDKLSAYAVEAAAARARAQAKAAAAAAPPPPLRGPARPPEEEDCDPQRSQKPLRARARKAAAVPQQEHETAPIVLSDRRRESLVGRCHLVLRSSAATYRD